jgi:hypothetical protein
MAKFKVDVNAADQADQVSEPDEAATSHCGEDFSAKAATIGVVVVGAALIEAALIPGIVIGVAAALAPKFLPKLGERLQPLFHSTVRGAYKLGRKARSAVGEAQERMHDIAAEVNAEEVAKAANPGAGASA